MKLFALNEGQKRRKTKTTFKNNNRLLNEWESSTKSSIYEIIPLWIKLITIFELS